MNQTTVAILASGLTILLYASDVLTLLAPFPLYFVSIVYGRSARLKTLVISLVAGLVVYGLLLPFLNANSSGSFVSSLTFFIPGTVFIDYFGIKVAQIYGIAYFVYFLLFGFLFGEGFLRKWPATKWFSVSVITTFAFAIVAFVTMRLFNFDLVAKFGNYMTGILGEMTMTQGSGIASESMMMIKENSEKIINSAMALMFSAFFLFGLAIAFLNFILAKWLIKADALFAHFGETTKLSVSHYFMWIAISLGFLFFANAYLLQNQLFGKILLNGIIIMAGIYFLQGVLIIAFYLKKTNLKFFRFIVYMLFAMFIQFTAPLAVMLGFMDLWVDFRRLVRKEITNQRSVPWK